MKEYLTVVTTGEYHSNKRHDRSIPKGKHLARISIDRSLSLDHNTKYNVLFMRHNEISEPEPYLSFNFLFIWWCFSVSWQNEAHAKTRPWLASHCKVMYCCLGWFSRGSRERKTQKRVLTDRLSRGRGALRHCAWLCRCLDVPCAWCSAWHFLKRPTDEILSRNKNARESLPFDVALFLLLYTIF